MCKGENAVCLQFFPVLTKVSRIFFLRVVKNRDCPVNLKLLMFTQTDVFWLTLSQTTNLDSSKLKEFADDNVKFD